MHVKQMKLGNLQRSGVSLKQFKTIPAISSGRCHLSSMPRTTQPPGHQGHMAGVHSHASQRVACRTATLEAPAQTVPSGTVFAEAVMLQSFGWDSCTKGGWYKMLMTKIPDMQAMGITHLWLPPPSQSVSAQGYMPGQLYNLTSKYGNKEELIALNKALHDAGIKTIADIVINHRCADEQVNGVWNKFRDDVDHHGKKIDWGRWAITGDDPNFKGTGNPDTGDDYGPAPDLDHANPELRAALTDWLGWLKDEIGFDGWRLDFVKGYGAQFVTEYINATTTGEELNVGEYWTDLRWEGSHLATNQDDARRKLVDWINANGKTCCAFDFPTKGILQEAIKNTQYYRLRDDQGKAAGSIGWLASRIVTFVDNHDTGSTQQHWPFPAEHVAQGYAYILTHPGIPCLFWDHLFTWGKDVKESILKLVELRKRNHLHSRSNLEILAADADLYVARIDNRVMIKMGPKGDMGKLVPSKEEGWKLALYGKNWAVWEKPE